MKLTAEHCNINVQVEISEDSDIHMVFNAFATLAMGMTYHPDTFMEACKQYIADMEE